MTGSAQEAARQLGGSACPSGLPGMARAAAAPGGVARTPKLSPASRTAASRAADSELHKPPNRAHAPPPATPRSRTSGAGAAATYQTAPIRTSLAARVAAAAPRAAAAAPAVRGRLQRRPRRHPTDPPLRAPSRSKEGLRCREGATRRQRCRRSGGHSAGWTKGRWRGSGRDCETGHRSLPGGGACSGGAACRARAVPGSEVWLARRLRRRAGCAGWAWLAGPASVAAACARARAAAPDGPTTPPGRPQAPGGGRTAAAAAAARESGACAAAAASAVPAPAARAAACAAAGEVGEPSVPVAGAAAADADAVTVGARATAGGAGAAARRPPGRPWRPAAAIATASPGAASPRPRRAWQWRQTTPRSAGPDARWPRPPAVAPAATEPAPIPNLLALSPRHPHETDCCPQARRRLRSQIADATGRRARLRGRHRRSWPPSQGGGSQR
eukprot:scaffold17676_cov108-Isochrysis_galbana.AAC.1